MQIAFLGYGNMARVLAGRWAPQHPVLFAGRDAGKAAMAAQEIGHGARAGSIDEALAFGEVVVFATTHEAIPALIDGLDAAALAGKVVLDINNPVDLETFLPKAEFAPSLGEYIQGRLPQARVVKAFNMCQVAVWAMDEPVFDGRRLVTMHCGDDVDAKATVAGLIEAVGSAPLDIGGIDRSRLLEPAACLVIQQLFAGRDLHTVLNLIQPEAKPIG